MPIEYLAGLSTGQTVILIAVAGALLSAGLALYLYFRESEPAISADDLDDETARELLNELSKDDYDPLIQDLMDSTASDVETDGGAISMRPTINRSEAGWKRLWKLWRHDRNQRKVADDGYIRWYLIDDTVSEPKFVKPERKGGGILEYDHDGVTYLFPREAMKPAEGTGMWTVMHHVDDAMPINISDPGKPSIDPDALKEYITQSVSSSPPSMLDTLFGGDWDGGDLIKGAIALVIVLAVAQGVFGGII